MDTHSPTDTTTVPNAKPKPTRRRLNAEGAAILEDQWKTHPGEIPSLAVRKSLTDRIQKTPGNDFYKVINTYRKVGTPHRLQPQPLILNLKILLAEHQNPSPEVITTCASLLAASGATYQDVVAYVHTGLHTSQPDRLPTPADTATPEPSLPPNSPTQPRLTAQAQDNVRVKKDLTQSPVLPPISVRPQYQGPSHYQGQSQFRVQSQLHQEPQFRHHRPSPALPSSPVSPGGAGISQDQRPQLPALQAIFRGVADAVASPTTPPDVLPSSAAEFNAMFAPYEKQLSQLVHALENS